MATPSVTDQFLGVLVVAMIGLGGFYLVRSKSAPDAFGGVALADLDSLSRYLEPVPPAPEIENYEMFLPAREFVPVTRPPIFSEPPQPRRLSAIMVIGQRPIAIIDDQQVSEGEMLPGGTIVVDITPVGVTLREPNGTQRTIQLPAEQ